VTARDAIRERRVNRVRARVLAPVERWTAARKYDACLALRRGAVTIAEVATAHGIPAEEIAGWMIAARDGGQDALRIAPRRRARAS
jgi:transposase-like protein